MALAPRRNGTEEVATDNGWVVCALFPFLVELSVFWDLHSTELVGGSFIFVYRGKGGSLDIFLY